MMEQSLHFIRPLWLVLAPLAVILPVVWRRLRRPSGDWSKVCDAHLLRWLSVGNGGSQTIAVRTVAGGIDVVDCRYCAGGPELAKTAG